MIHFRRNILCALVLLSLMLSLFPLSTAASAKKYTDTVQWYYEEGVLTLSGTGFVPGASPILPWEKYHDSITEVVIGSGITALGNRIFRNCTSLKKVTLPEGLTEIGIECFAGCTNLTEINWPSTLDYLDRRAFYGCSSLTSITIPSGMSTIESEAFGNCKNLKEVHIPSISVWLSIKFVDNTATPLYSGADLLLNGEPLTDVVIPDGVTEVGQFIFSGCKSLTSVVLPDSITQICPQAFAGCENLKSVSLPAGLQLIGGDAFRGCGALERVIYRGHLLQLSKTRVHMNEEDPLLAATWTMPQPYLTISIVTGIGIFLLAIFLVIGIPVIIIILIAKKKDIW